MSPSTAPRSTVFSSLSTLLSLVTSARFGRAPLLALCIGLAAGAAGCGSANTEVTAEKQTFAVEVLKSPAAVPTTLDQQVLSYEIHFVNETQEPTRISAISIKDGSGRALTELSGASLEDVLRAHTSDFHPTAPSALLGSAAGAVVLFDLMLPLTQTPPTELVHSVRLESAKGASEQTVRVLVDATPVIVLTPPVKGPDWFMDGAYGAKSYHRRSTMPIDKKFFTAERYAIDFEIINDAGNLVEGDISDNTHWLGWGKPLYAVAAGEVVSVVVDMPQQTPPNFPSDTTVENAVGNSVVLKISEGVFAAYAHLQTNGATVAVGQRVQAGDLLGYLGNSGNSTAPHLHFQLMDGPDPLRSEGVPFVFASMTDRGQATEVDLLRGKLAWDANSVRTPLANRLPSLNRVIDFAD
jgi:hypothetical protein